MEEKEILLQKFGTNLAELRKTKGLSIHQLAAASGLEYSHVQRIEKGKVNLALTTLLALADGLDCQPPELLSFNH